MPFFYPDQAIYPIGDSVTVGLTDTPVGAGYPTILINSLQVDTHLRWTETPDRYASGGWTVAYVAANIDAELAAQSDTPNYVLIYLGANDTGGGALPDESTYKTNLAYVLDALRAKWANAKIYCGVNHWEGHEDLLQTLITWNATVISGRSNVFAGLDGTFMSGHPEWMDDAVHPNHDGFIQIAAGWKTIIGY